MCSHCPSNTRVCRVLARENALLLPTINDHLGFLKHIGLSVRPAGVFTVQSPGVSPEAVRRVPFMSACDDVVSMTLCTEFV
jgi:hypothetical protein